ncbi:MAG: ACT domain-containing protein [bacterium]
MYRETQIVAFLKNAPGQLAGLCQLLREKDINILGMSIQNAEDYVRGLLKARELTGRRIATAASYGSIIRDSEDYSVIRFVVERNQSQQAVRVLEEAGYPVETTPVLVIILENRPGSLGETAAAFAREGINIDYVYGSVLSGSASSLFIVHVKEEDLERAASLFQAE